MPRATDATLLSTLNGSFEAVDLYTFALASGTVRYTTDSASLSFGGNTWTPAVIERDNVREAEGVEVSTLDLTVRISTWPMLAVNGDLDNVEVTVQRTYLPTPGATPSMLSVVFSGRVADVRPLPTGAALTVKDERYQGESECPPRIVGPSCPWQFGGTECGVTLATWTTSVTTTTGSTTTLVKLTGAPGGNAIPGSVVEFTSGALDGIKRTVKSVSGSDLTLTRPLPSAPASGVTLDVVKGCPRTLAACSGFSALARYGGYPFVPRKESK